MIENYSIALKDSRWLKFVLGSALVFSAEFSLINYTNVRLSHNFDPVQIASINIDGIYMFTILQLINTLIIILFTFSISKISAKFNKGKIMIFGLIIYVLGYSVISYQNSMLILIIMMVFATIGELLFSPVWQSKQVELIPSNKRASYAALGSLTNTFATLFAGMFLIISDFTSSLTVSIFIIFLGYLGIVLIKSTITQVSNDSNKRN